MHLTQHTHIHAGEKHYECLECGEGLPPHTPLSLHRRTHTGEKPFKCSEGEEGLQPELTAHDYQANSYRERNSSEAMSVEEAVSRAIRLLSTVHFTLARSLYDCNGCGESIYLELTLLDHQQIHTAEKAYESSLCGKAFSQSLSLSQPLRTMQGRSDFHTACN
nr:zinc finger protein 157-like [Oryctolagus cuniculus]